MTKETAYIKTALEEKLPQESSTAISLPENSFGGLIVAVNRMQKTVVEISRFLLKAHEDVISARAEALAKNEVAGEAFRFLQILYRYNNLGIVDDNSLMMALNSATTAKENFLEASERLVKAQTSLEYFRVDLNKVKNIFLACGLEASHFFKNTNKLEKPNMHVMARCMTMFRVSQNHDGKIRDEEVIKLCRIIADIEARSEQKDIIHLAPPGLGSTVFSLFYPLKTSKHPANDILNNPNKFPGSSPNMAP